MYFLFETNNVVTSTNKNKLDIIKGTLKEKYQGKSAIVFGNGPSISQINFNIPVFSEEKLPKVIYLTNC